MPLRGRKSQQQKPISAGGEKLRNLRQAARLSLVELAAKLEIDLGKSIDTKHINKIETGGIKKPLAETLEAILEGLNASYRDRRDVLETFGYSLSRRLPTDSEIDEIRALTVNELKDATYPMLLIDFGHRLLAWNRYAPRLIGRHPDDPTLSTFYGVTTFDLVFNPTLGGRLLVENPDEFGPAWLHMVKSDLHESRHEAWFAALFGRVRGLPGFSDIWDAVPEAPTRLVTPLSVVPLQLNVPGTGVLQFRLSTSDFLLDSRFQLIHFTPFGAVTLRACAVWAEEEGVM
jgi:transcriptional regulator with XRE-family HTH domain